MIYLFIKIFIILKLQKPIPATVLMPVVNPRKPSQSCKNQLHVCISIKKLLNHKVK